MVTLEIFENGRLASESSFATVGEACSFFRRISGFCESSDLILQILQDFGRVSTEHNGYVGIFTGSPE